jgi:hypothetical protein
MQPFFVADSEYRDDIRVMQPRDCFRFATETADRFRRVKRCGRQNFQSNVTPQ